MANIRMATAADATSIAAIYGPYCDGTVISFEETAPTADEMARRIASIGATRPWIVLEDEGAIIGYAYASAHHERAAYRWSVSTAVYVSRDHHRRGAGRALYTTLFALLRVLGYRQATAGITSAKPGQRGPSRGLWFRSRRRLSSDRLQDGRVARRGVVPGRDTAGGRGAHGAAFCSRALECTGMAGCGETRAGSVPCIR